MLSTTARDQFIRRHRLVTNLTDRDWRPGPQWPRSTLFSASGPAGEHWLHSPTSHWYCSHVTWQGIVSNSCIERHNNKQFSTDIGTKFRFGVLHWKSVEKFTRISPCIRSLPFKECLSNIFVESGVLTVQKSSFILHAVVGCHKNICQTSSPFTFFQGCIKILIAKKSSYAVKKVFFSQSTISVACDHHLIGRREKRALHVSISYLRNENIWKWRDVYTPHCRLTMGNLYRRQDSVQWRNESDDVDHCHSVGEATTGSLSILSMNSFDSRDDKARNTSRRYKLQKW